MSNTPRTDQAVTMGDFIDLCQQLERELNEAVKFRDTYKAQLDAALERIKYLENQTHSTGMNL